MFVGFHSFMDIRRNDYIYNTALTVKNVLEK